MDIKTKPLNEWSIKEITDLIKKNIQDISSLIKLYPSIVRIYLEKLGFKIRQTDNESINTVFVEEIKRILECTAGKIDFDEKGQITDGNNVLLSISSDNKIIINLEGYKMSCNEIILTSGIYALKISREYLPDAFKLLYETVDSVSDFCKNTLLLLPRLTDKDVTLKMIEISSYFSQSHELYKNVNESYKCDYDGSEINICSTFNVEMDNPIVNYKKYIDCKLSARFMKEIYKPFSSRFADFWDIFGKLLPYYSSTLVDFDPELRYSQVDDLPGLYYDESGIIRSYYINKRSLNDTFLRFSYDYPETYKWYYGEPELFHCEYDFTESRKELFTSKNYNYLLLIFNLQTNRAFDLMRYMRFKDERDNVNIIKSIKEILEEFSKSKDIRGGK